MLSHQTLAQTPSPNSCALCGSSSATTGDGRPPHGFTMCPEYDDRQLLVVDHCAGTQHVMVRETWHNVTVGDLAAYINSLEPDTAAGVQPLWKRRAVVANGTSFDGRHADDRLSSSRVAPGTTVHMYPRGATSSPQTLAHRAVSRPSDNDVAAARFVLERLACKTAISPVEPQQPAATEPSADLTDDAFTAAAASFEGAAAASRTAPSSMLLPPAGMQPPGMHSHSHWASVTDSALPSAVWGADDDAASTRSNNGVPRSGRSASQQPVAMDPQGEPQARTVHVKYWPIQASRTVVRSVADQYGTVLKVRRRDLSSDSPFTFLHIEYETPEQAEALVAAAPQIRFNERDQQTLHASIARSGIRGIARDDAVQVEATGLWLPCKFGLVSGSSGVGCQDDSASSHRMPHLPPPPAPVPPTAGVLNAQIGMNDGNADNVTSNSLISGTRLRQRAVYEQRARHFAERRVNVRDTQEVVNHFRVLRELARLDVIECVGSAPLPPAGSHSAGGSLAQLPLPAQTAIKSCDACCHQLGRAAAMSDRSLLPAAYIAGLELCCLRLAVFARYSRSSAVRYATSLYDGCGAIPLANGGTSVAATGTTHTIAAMPHRFERSQALLIPPAALNFLLAAALIVEPCDAVTAKALVKRLANYMDMSPHIFREAAAASLRAAVTRSEQAADVSITASILPGITNMVTAFAQGHLRVAFFTTMTGTMDEVTAW